MKNKYFIPLVALILLAMYFLSQNRSDDKVIGMKRVMHPIHKDTSFNDTIIPIITLDKP